MKYLDSILKRSIEFGNYFGKKKVILACMPKTASTFLQKVFSVAGNLECVDLSENLNNSEQELSLLALARASMTNGVAHIHMCATMDNVKLLKRYDHRPIVMIRNIEDIIVSMRGHCAIKSLLWPMVYVEKTFLQFKKEKQYDYIIDLFMPWFIKFYVSWYRVKEQNTLDTHWITYEELISNKENEIKKAFDFCGIQTSMDAIHDAVHELEKHKHKSNINKGINGRGKTELSDDQRLRLKNLARYYPDVDFSPIGL